MKRLALVALLGCGLSPPAAAAPMPLTRPLGMGEAYRAAGGANGAIYYNPAGMSRLRMYSIEWSWLRFSAEESVFHMSVVDTKTQNVGVGLGYSLLSGEPASHDGRLALSYAPIPMRLFFGTGIRYLFVDLPDGTDNIHALAFDAGVSADLGEGFVVGVVAHNLLNDVQTALTSDRTFGFGLAWEAPVSLAADLVFDPALEGPERFSYHAGVETMVGREVPIRAGWSHEPTNGGAHYLSIGVGFVNPAAGLELGLRRRLDGDQTTSVGISVKSFL